MDPADRALPLLEFDPAPHGLFAPSPPVLSEPWPRLAVLCYFHEQIAALSEQGVARRVGRLSRETGGNAIHVATGPGGEPVALVHPGVGAPAAVLTLERVIAAGVDSVVVCGSDGALVPLALGHVVVPTSAVRHEGTSYHYAPPAPVIEADPDVIARVSALLDDRAVPYTTGRTWTTDAPFRETPAVIEARRREGCLTVEMEAAALFAAARFRDVRLAALLYAGDDLSSPRWDSRHWTRAEARPALLALALEAVTRLDPPGAR